VLLLALNIVNCDRPFFRDIRISEGERFCYSQAGLPDLRNTGVASPIHLVKFRPWRDCASVSPTTVPVSVVRFPPGFLVLFERKRRRWNPNCLHPFRNKIRFPCDFVCEVAVFSIHHSHRVDTMVPLNPLSCSLVGSSCAEVVPKFPKRHHPFLQDCPQAHATL
jgi:hypothetical protein